MSRTIALERPGAGQPAVWIGSTDMAGVLIRHGSKGRSLRSLTIPVNECRNGDPEAELRARADAKLAEGKGYREVPPEQYTPPVVAPAFPAQHAVSVDPAVVSLDLIDLARTLAGVLEIPLTETEGTITSADPTVRCTLTDGIGWAIQASTLHAKAHAFAAGLAIAGHRQLIDPKGQRMNPATALKGILPRLTAEQQEAIETLGLFASSSRLLASIGGPSLAF